MDNKQSAENQVIKAFVDKTFASSFVNDVYGIRVKRVRELNGFDDRNFHIEVEDDFENPYLNSVCQSGYTLKVINKLDSENTDFIDVMDSILYYCHEQNLCVPIPVKNKLGTFWSKKSIVDKNSRENVHVIRLLTYLPGTTVSNVPYTASVLYQWGKLLAKFHQSVNNYPEHSLKERKTLWSLTSIPKILEYLFCIEMEERRSLIKSIVNKFMAMVLNEVGSLPTGIIHGDFNEYNVLVREKEEKGEYEVYGILDFGDLHIAPKVFDVAIMLTYTILECKTMSLEEASGHALAGYISDISLTEKEYRILKICMLARLSQSLTLGAYTFRLDPSNLYALSSARMGWNVLSKLWETSDCELNEVWTRINRNYMK
ncbi:hydroxylysine kinase isoform X2 [Centruroides vittatus]|uniref:hydroxylysine kinase isoform X2 n=1 Tax=Centruroides vittatus TaxID=120091 RepID=UPI0035109AF9